jgi:hypothetical protein
MTVPAAPPPPKRGVGTAGVVAITLGVLVAVCMVIGTVVMVATGGKDAAQTASADRPAVAAPTTAPIFPLNTPITSAPVVPSPTTATTTEAPPPPAGPASTIITDGTFDVGTDILAGKYKARVPADSFACYWARLRGTSGDGRDIIANNIVQPGGQALVTIAKTDKAFETQGCGTWTKVG